MATHGLENTLTSNESKPMVTDRGRNYNDTRSRLTEWLSEYLPQARDLTLSSLSNPIGAGVSNETVLFEAEWQEDQGRQCQGFVLRFHPSGYQMFLDPGFERQIALIKSLHASGFPAPRILWDEHDPAVLGSPFFVMERVSGRVPVSHPVYNLSGWLFDAPIELRRAVWENAMHQMAGIHRFKASDLPFLHRPQYGADTFAQEYAYWRAAYAWSADGVAFPIIEEAFSWLDAHYPSIREEGLAWGDARIGNMMFGEDGAVRVVLDWEQASLAGGLHDLAWWLTMDDMFSTGIGVKRLDGLGSREETIALWAELTGRSTQELLWHEVFACVRGATLVIRQCALKGQKVPGNNGNNNLFTRQLAVRVGWNRPEDVC